MQNFRVLLSDHQSLFVISVITYCLVLLLIYGSIVKKLGPVTDHVDIGGGKIVKCHIDQLAQCLEPSPVTRNETIENLTTEDNFQYRETVGQPRQEPVTEAQLHQQDHYPQRV